MNNSKATRLQKEVNKRTIFRKAHNQENPYAQISKKILRDNRLSAKAMGLMCYFLSLPDNWEINITELIKHFSDGEKSIRAGIRELILIGYIKIQQSRGSNGRFSSTTFLIYEESIKSHKALEPHRVSPYAQKRHAVNRHAENGALINTENTKDRIIKNNNNNVSNEVKLKIEPEESVVVVLMKKLQSLAISKVLVTSWLKKHGMEYIIEKIELTENQKPHNPEGFLNKAIAQDWKPALRRQSEDKGEGSNEPIYPSHDENVAWYGLLTDEDKFKHLQLAIFKYPMLEAHLKHQQISILDVTFSDHGLFKTFMSLLGELDKPAVAESVN